ncbi:MAG: hypothetical protein ABI885_25810 [Gammaproteobacteria bacterium]
MPQRALLLLASILAVSSAPAATQDDVLNALTKCADLPDGPARLDCYDRLAPQVRAAAATRDAAPARSPAISGPATTGSAVAGANTPAAANAYQPMGGEILPMEMGVSSYQIKRDGTFTVTLDNTKSNRPSSSIFSASPHAAVRLPMLFSATYRFSASTAFLE